MKLTIFIVAVISAAIVAVAIMLSMNPDADFKSNIDNIPVNTQPNWDLDLYIETTTADYWERVKGLNKNKETSADSTDVNEFVTDENGEIVTDENGEPVISKKYENVTDVNGEAVTDEDGKPVTYINNETVTDEDGNIVSDVSEENDKKASVTEVPDNRKKH